MTALEELHAAQVNTPVVAFSSAGWPELRVAAEMLSATSFVPTMAEPSRLRGAVGLAVSSRW